MAHFGWPTKDSQFKIEKELTIRLCGVIDTPLAREVAKLLIEKRYPEYLDLECNPADYDSYGTFANDYLVVSLLRKSPNMPLDVDPKAAATAAFFEAEQLCKEANLRLSPERGPVLNVPKFESVPFWEERLRRKLADMLGPLSASIGLLEEHFRHSTGADTELSGHGTTPSEKYSAEIGVLPAMLPYLKALMGERWFEENHTRICIRTGNVFFTVPKKATTDRGCCKEPRLALYGQLAIGGLLRRCLQLHDGTVLEKQPDVNREFASRAQKDGLATVDLSQASDLMNIMAVLRYFPEDWVRLFLLFRSATTTVEGRTVSLEKFLAMGCGFAFELETVLFKAVAEIVTPPSRVKKDVAVFGDDIIVPQECAPALIGILEFLGFRVNTEKSFLAGRFFESCGTDWFDGFNVRPFFLKGASPTTPYSVSLANALRLWSSRINGGEYCDARFKPVWQWLVSLSPRWWTKLSVPPELGDTGLVSSHAEFQKQHKSLNTNLGSKVKVKAALVVSKEACDWSLNLSNLSTTRVLSQDPADYVESRRVSRDLTVLQRLTKTGNDMECGYLLYDKRVGSYTICDAEPTGNMEPVRGLYGQIVTRSVTIWRWRTGLDWLG